MRTMLAIAVGAAVGANLRYLISSWASIRLGADFPYGTLIVNLIGSLAVGIFAGLVLRMPVLEPWRALVVTGFLGGLTTFSTFSYELMRLIERGQMAAAFGYLTLSVLLGLAAASFGLLLARG